MLLHGVIDRLLLTLKVCAMCCVSLVQLLFIVQSQKHWMICSWYWAISIQYSVDSIEQYPLNILWTVLSSPLNVLWTVLRSVYFMLAVFRNIRFLLTVLPYTHCIMWTVLRNVHSKHVENENLMSSNHFHSPIAYRNGYTLTVGDCFLLLVFVVATVGLQSWAADQVLDRATTTNCCSCLLHWTLSLS